MIISADEFARLRTSEKPDEYLRAANDEATLSIWKEIISGFPEMRTWVAHNKTVPIDILEILARDESIAVRAAVADKRKLTVELFELLVQDCSELVRLRIAHNRKLPIHLLKQLLDDPSPLVVATAEERLGHRERVG